MLSAEHEVTIARPPAEVFAFVADGLNAPKWRPGVLDISLASGTGLGAVYKQGVKGPGGRRIDADYRITALEPNRRLSFEAIAGPVRPTGQFVFDDVNGATRLKFALQAELGGIKKANELCWLSPDAQQDFVLIPFPCWHSGKEIVGQCKGRRQASHQVQVISASF